MDTAAELIQKLGEFGALGIICGILLFITRELWKQAKEDRLSFLNYLQDAQKENRTLLADYAASFKTMNKTLHDISEMVRDHCKDSQESHNRIERKI